MKISRRRIWWIVAGVMAVVFLGMSSKSVSAAEEIDVRTKAANKIYFFDECMDGGGKFLTGSVADFEPNGEFNENAARVMTGLLKAGYSQAETAGVIGSLKGESGSFNPGEGENGKMNDVKENDMKFRITNSACYPGRCGFGIAQWTWPTRQEQLQQFADGKNMSVASLDLQVEFLIKELKERDFKPGSAKFETNGQNNAEAAGRAATAVCEKYEVPGNSEAEVKAKCNNSVRNSVGLGKVAFNFMENNKKSGSSVSSSSVDEDGVSASDASNVVDEGKNVTIIGDSITEGADQAGSFKKKLKNADIHRRYSKSMTRDGDSTHGGESGKTILTKLINEKKLREIVVVALGTNDGLTKNVVQEVVDLINSDGNHTIVFVTNYGVKSDYTSNNNVFKAIQGANSNVVLANWEGAVSSDPGKYMRDNVHPKSGVGTDLFVETIYEALTGGVTKAQARQYNNNCRVAEEESDTNGNGVTFAKYKGQTIAFPLAGATKDNITGQGALSNIPCGHSIGCHYGPGSPAGNAAAAFDMCMKDSNKCSNDTTVVSITDGTITRAIQTTRNGAQCNHVRIKSSIDGTVFAYMHLRYETSLPWHAGDKVKAGDVIGHVASDGACHDYSTPHVHIDKGQSTSATGGPTESERDPELVKYINAAYSNLPKNEAELRERQSSGGNISESGLSYEQAKEFMKKYGANLNDSSMKVMGQAQWNSCNGGGSNCVSFSAFFYNKFTSNKRSIFGNGNEVANNLANDKGVKLTNTPKVWSVFSWSGGPQGWGHTGVILGYKDGEWIVGHASCSRTGKGKGNGEESGGGSGFVRKSKDINTAIWGVGQSNIKYADVSGIVDEDAILNYLNSGK